MVFGFLLEGIMGEFGVVRQMRQNFTAVDKV